ncbi:hypothetical protein KA977_08010, partial [Candidatus Dependentiae bacterium]|nr:hypothetical protein [Candidatus Dependentiae bacterium]
MKIKLTKHRKLKILFGIIAGFIIAEIISYNYINYNFLKYAVKPANKILIDTNNYRIAVLGESTAIGWPYHKKLQLSNIIQYEFNKTKHYQKNIIADNYAQGAFSIEKAVQKYFSEVKYKPDLMIIYSGHNEFSNYYSLNIKDKLPFLNIIGFSSIVKIIRHYFYIKQVNESDDIYSGNFFCEHPVPEFEKNINFTRYIKYAELLIQYCNANNIELIIIIPEGNYMFSPTRSVYRNSKNKNDAGNHLNKFKSAYYLKNFMDDSDASKKILENLSKECSFANLYFEIGKIYYQENHFNSADKFLRLAIDNDDYPLIIQTKYKNGLKDLINKYNLIHIDMKSIICTPDKTVIPDFNYFIDGHHPNLSTYFLLVENIITKISRYKNSKFFINTGYSHRINSNEIQEYFKYAEEDEIHVYGIISLWFEEFQDIKFLKQYDSI